MLEYKQFYATIILCVLSLVIYILDLMFKRNMINISKRRNISFIKYKTKIRNITVLFIIILIAKNNRQIIYVCGVLVLIVYIYRKFSKDTDYLDYYKRNKLNGQVLKISNTQYYSNDIIIQNRTVIFQQGVVNKNIINVTFESCLVDLQYMESCFPNIISFQIVFKKSTPSIKRINILNKFQNIHTLCLHIPLQVLNIKYIQNMKLQKLTFFALDVKNFDYVQNFEQLNFLSIKIKHQQKQNKMKSINKCQVLQILILEWDQSNLLNYLDIPMLRQLELKNSSIQSIFGIDKMKNLDSMIIKYDYQRDFIKIDKIKSLFQQNVQPLLTYMCLNNSNVSTLYGLNNFIKLSRLEVVDDFNKLQNLSHIPNTVTNFKFQGSFNQYNNLSKLFNLQQLSLCGCKCTVLTNLAFLNKLKMLENLTILEHSIELNELIHFQNLKNLKFIQLEVMEPIQQYKYHSINKLIQHLAICPSQFTKITFGKEEVASYLVKNQQIKQKKNVELIPYEQVRVNKQYEKIEFENQRFKLDVINQMKLNEMKKNKMTQIVMEISNIIRVVEHMNE